MPQRSSRWTLRLQFHDRGTFRLRSIADISAMGAGAGTRPPPGADRLPFSYSALRL
jgi:hypothetical protein